VPNAVAVEKPALDLHVALEVPEHQMSIIGVTPLRTSCLTQYLLLPSRSVSDPAVAEETGFGSHGTESEAEELHAWQPSSPRPADTAIVFEMP
jgi:hypothetical protein